MGNGLQFSTFFVRKVKRFIVFFGTILVGILLIWRSSSKYVRKEAPELRSYPFYTQVIQISPKKNGGIKHHLEYACAEMKKNNYTEYEDTNKITETDWLISDRFKLTACKNFIVGSTNIARVLYTLDHLQGQRDSNKIGMFKARNTAKMKNKTPEKLDILFNSYTKFMFIRDPIERLLSAYRDDRPSVRYKQKHNLTSFKLFLEHLIPIPDSKVNRHMVSFTRMCNPCRVKYDFIGSMDNYEADMGNILESVGANKYVILPHRNQTGYAQRKTEDVLNQHLKDVPKSLIQKVYEKYYWDYFLFGFPKPDY